MTAAQSAVSIASSADPCIQCTVYRMYIDVGPGLALDCLGFVFYPGLFFGTRTITDDLKQEGYTPGEREVKYVFTPTSQLLCTRFDHSSWSSIWSRCFSKVAGQGGNAWWGLFLGEGLHYLHQSTH